MHKHCHFHACLHLSILFVLLSSLLTPSVSMAQSNAQGKPFSVSSAAAAPWIDAQQFGGVVYLLYSSPQSIKRYQISTESWLSDIPLSGTPTAFRVTSDAIYVGFGQRAAKLNLNGGGETHLLNTSWNIIALFVNGPILILNCSYSLYANLITYNLTTQTPVDSKSFYPYSMEGSSLAPSIYKMFGRTSGISPADIVQATFTADGLITGQSDSPYHADFPSASKTWVSPDDKVVIDDTGTIYNTANLSYRSSLGGSLDDLAFYGNLPIVLRGGDLVAYSNTYLETGRTSPVFTPLSIFVVGETIYGFYDSSTGPMVNKTPVSALNPQEPGLPVDPNGLAYTPDLIQMGSDETVYLLSKKFQSIFRWSLPQRKYLSTLPLLDVPYTFTYAANENRLYTVYPNGSINQIDLTGELNEKPFANLPSSPCGLAMAGSYVFTCDNSGSWVTHTVFSPTGQILSWKDWNYYSEEYVWNAARQKMYFFRDDTSPNDVLWEDIDANGILRNKIDSPYHGDFAFVHPIRVKPDGSIVLIGTGNIFDGLTLSKVNTLSNGISDADWKGDTLVTLRSLTTGSELQQWTPNNYGIAKSKLVNGSSLRLFSVGEGWLTITLVSDHPRFSIWSTDLSTVVTQPIAAFTASPISGTVPLVVNFTNQSSDGSITSSSWDFGDGSTSTEVSPVHTYTKAGSFSVKLTVSGPGGADTLIKTAVIQVEPVTAKFTASTIRGQAPLKVDFLNQTIGQYESVLWDFGDGSTSTEQSPSHIYQNQGIYTVKLSVDGSYGSSTSTLNNLIEVTNHSYLYLPVLYGNPAKPLLQPGHYSFNNLCQQFPLYIGNVYTGQMRECVPSVDIHDDGTMYFNYSWTFYQSTGFNSCLIKYSDQVNSNMYIKDSAGIRYDSIDVGGSGFIDCMVSGYVYTGWFKFPQAKTKNTIFTFYDDDSKIQIGPILLAGTP